jgi:hypothetical protein
MQNVEIPLIRNLQNVEIPLIRVSQNVEISLIGISQNVEISLIRNSQNVEIPAIRNEYFLSKFWSRYHTNIANAYLFKLIIPTVHRQLGAMYALAFYGG